jgi:hypothetical protein
MPDGKANIPGMHPHANGTGVPDLTEDRAGDKDRKAAEEAETALDPRRDVRG